MKHIIILFFFIFITSSIFSQTYPTGLLFNDESYSSLPLSATLSKSDYSLPSSFSLRPWCPSIGNQGAYGTCVGWALGYYARTIIEAMEKNWNTSDINNESYSPSWVYNQIRFSYDNHCSEGAFLEKALDLLKNKGAAKIKDYPYCCNCSITQSIRNKASKHKISSYKKLFNIRANNNTKIKAVKKSLSEKKPVVIGFMIENSFSNARDVWNPVSRNIVGGHAMCVVAYDDNKYGGAFLLINSWGKSWGNNGYTYVRYNDFAEYCKYAFEMIEKRKETDILLSGKLNFKLKNGQTMKSKGKAKNQIITYEMQDSYSSLTKFRFSMCNNKSAYVYAIATDLGGEIHQIFPHKKGISPYLGYSSNTVVLPSETSYIQMDSNPGTDFLCVFYSKEKLDIKNIIKKMEIKRGSNLNSRITYALGNSMLPTNKIKYSDGEIKFDAKINNSKYIVPLIVKINHQ